MRDYEVGATFDIKFTTIASTGAPITLAGTPVISAYPDNGTTQLTAGITLSVDFDGVTGLHNVRVVATTGNGYAAGSTYALVITTGTVSGVSVVGYVVGEFSLGRSAAFGRLGAPAGASVSADVAAVKAETAAILDDTDLIDDGTSGLAKIATDVAAILVDTGTTLQGELDGIQADTEDIQTRLPAALVGGRIDATIDGTGLEAGALALINAEVDTALADYDGPTHAELVSEVNAVQADIAALNDLSAADVNAEVDAAIETYHLDHLLAATYDPASKPGAADALLNELVENDGGVARFTANALEQGPAGSGGDATEAKQDTIIALIGTPANTDLAGDLADIEGKVDDLESRLGTPSNLGSGATVAANLADIEAQTDDIGAAGAGLTALASAANLATVASDLAALDSKVDDVLTAVETDLPATLATIAAFLDTEIAAILADTNELQTDWVNGGRLDLLIDAIKAKTDQLAFTTANQVDARVLTNSDKTGYSVGTGGIAAGSFSANAIDAAALATDAVGEIVAAVFARAFSAGYNALTFDQIVKVAIAALAGKASGLETTEATYRNLADSADVIVAQVDADGNRTGVTLTP